MVVLDTSRSAIFTVAVATVAVTLSADKAKLLVTVISALPTSTSTVVAVAIRSVVVTSRDVAAVTLRVSASTTVPATVSSKVLSAFTEMRSALCRAIKSSATSSISCCDCARTN